MIDFQDMVRRQQLGSAQITTLQGDEKAVLQHYCSLATEDVLTEGTKRNATIDQVVINAIRLGIGLGLELKITNGEVQGR